MSGIAEILLSAGMRVTGSDIASSKVVERLRSLGAKVFIGHAAENLGEPDAAVVSNIIPPDNPEAQAARGRGIPVVERAEMLAEIMRGKFNLAVSGTHGKTTTTALIGWTLERGGLDPTVVNGGRFVASGQRRPHSARANILRRKRTRRMEASSGSIRRIAVVTSVDADHLDYYKNVEEIGETLVDFANRVPFYGMSVWCADSEASRRWLPKVKSRRLTYGFWEGADARALDATYCKGSSQFNVFYKGSRLGSMRLPLPGRTMC